MDEQRTTAPRKRRGLRIFGIIVAVILVLLVVVYFVGTSEAFFKSAILPRVSKSMNATITVEKASISPFSHVLMRNVKVVTTGSEPLLTAQEVHARYSLMKIIGGNIVVQDAQVVSPKINLVENPDGSSNLDPITKGKKSEEKKPSKSSKPPQVDIQNFALSNATLRKTKLYKGGASDVTEISNLNITLQNLQNGQSGKLRMEANVAVNNNPPAPGTNGTLQAKLNGDFTFALQKDLTPSMLKGATGLAVDKATGSFSQVTGLGAKLVADLTPTELKEVAFRFEQGGNALGELRASGPFDASKKEGKVRVELVSLDRRVLNLFGASKGLDFGPTTINSTNEVELTKGGSLAAVAGQLNVGKFTVNQAGQTTPPLDLQGAYQLTVDRTAASADLQKLSLRGTQNQKELLHADLSAPMKLSWGENAQPTGDSAFNLVLTNLNLADWKPFVGDTAPAGIVGLNLKVTSGQSGKLLAFDASSQAQGLTVNFGSNSLANVAMTLQAQGTASDLQKFDLKSYQLNLSEQNQPMLSVSGKGVYDKQADTADMQMVIDGNLPLTLKALAGTNSTASSGKLGLNAHVIKAKDAQTITGSLNLADFTGRYGDYAFDRFGSLMDLDVHMKGKQLQIRKANGKVTSAANPGGAFDLSGNYDLDKKGGQIELRLSDFNQNGLRPFLESKLGEKKLVSVTLTSSTSARLEGDDASVKANLQIANLVVSDPKKRSPETPLEAKLQLDASMMKKVLELRQLQATLTPTDRAKNEVQVDGKVDMSNTNAITGNLKLTADSLDVTRYYDLFAGKEEEAKPVSPQEETAGTRSPGSQPAAKVRKEPDPMHLPVENFVADANIGRFYLRELAITNLQTGIKVNHDDIAIEPLQMAINGAPVSGKMNVNVGVPGYKYDVTFKTGEIPLEPLANTFAPTKRGKYKGQLLTDLQIAGSGVTGASMKQSLGGHFTFNFTNANIQIVNPQLRGFLLPIATFLGAPDLLDSPINQIDTRANVINGKISMNQLKLVSEAFLAESKGDITIADDLMKSTFNDWPMHFSIRSTLAQKVRIAPKTSATNETYAALPDFIKVAGTLDAPKPKLDLNVQSIAGTLLEKYGGKIPGVNEKTGNLIEGVGGILGGKTDHSQGGATNQPGRTNTTQQTTNAPTHSSPLDLLDQFRKKK